MTNFHGTVLGVAILIASVMPASADTEWSQKAINNPAESWGIWGQPKIEFSRDTALPDKNFRRVIISPQPDKAWDIGGYVQITKPVKKGDVLLLAFWARAYKVPVGGDFIEVSGRIHESAPPQTSVAPETQFVIGKQWKLFYASGTADKDYPVGTLSCDMLLGTGDQAVDLVPAYVVDYGSGYALDALPQN
jgi:hypothetical protein